MIDVSKRGHRTIKAQAATSSAAEHRAAMAKHELQHDLQMCAQMLMRATAHGGCTNKIGESALLRWLWERKLPCRTGGIEPEPGFSARHATHWAIPLLPLLKKKILYAPYFLNLLVFLLLFFFFFLSSFPKHKCPQMKRSLHSWEHPQRVRMLNSKTSECMRRNPDQRINFFKIVKTITFRHYVLSTIEDLCENKIRSREMMLVTKTGQKKPHQWPWRSHRLLMSSWQQTSPHQTAVCR